MSAERTGTSRARIDSPQVTATGDGAVPVALAAGSVGVLLLATGLALLAGLSWWQATLVAVAASMLVSALAGVALAALAARAAAPLLPVPRQEEQPRPAAGTTSAQRATARAIVNELERQLVRAVEQQAESPDLMSRALALHEARLRLARVMLAEDGDLPQELKDELVVAHRGVAAWLEADATP